MAKSKKKKPGLFGKKGKKQNEAGLDGRGWRKWIDVYRQNPSLGDPNTIEQQLSENAKELDTLNVDLHKYTRQQPPPAPTCRLWLMAAPPLPAPAPPPAMLVPPAWKNLDDEEEFEEDETSNVKVIYSFTGKTFLPFLVLF
ncbi:Formin-binding protein 1 [Desmophyllum pertusum]|uniref:Formin-binding protein 1 n=1 Tax=Desmophyllum pertusum TaxID=174260 RepID=A0A9W9YD50_9CNID|nr:Formin-binding protein 1 [Desmophyllum pertusum]